ncbi:MAG: acyltransferase [Cyanobacteria bacterium]|nr:acyltransferase [Cyanobacteriota bacterium]
MTARTERGVVPALDGLRGIAIVLVMLHHSTYYRPTSGIDAVIGDVLFFFWIGVDLFFVLSGFLITGILLDTRDGDRYFTNFYARRTLRIFPLYYLVLFVALVVLPEFPAVNAVLNGQDHQVALPAQWPYWSYLTNFAIADRGWVHWVDVGWSLAIEEQFYLVWPLVIWLCPPRRLAWLCTVIFVAEVFARSFARASEVPVLPLYVVTWFRLDGLMIGALLAVSLRSGIMPSLNRLAPFVVIAGIAGLIAVTIQGGHTWWWNRRMQQFGYSLIAVSAGAMLVSAISLPDNSRWSRILRTKWLRAFGRYSYCLYLIHLPVMRAVREYVFNPEDYTAMAPWIGQVSFYIAAATPAFALAWLSWRLFEAPILRLKARFPYSRVDRE